MTFDARSIAVRSHGRYLIDAPERAGATLVGFHGYQENAAIHLEVLRRVAAAMPAETPGTPMGRAVTLISIQALNRFYTRVVPSHAVELTAALLDRQVAGVLARHRLSAATLKQKQDLAALIHLCGAGAGDAFARRGLRLTPGQRCGDHDVRRYLGQVNALKRQFANMTAPA